MKIRYVRASYLAYDKYDQNVNVNEQCFRGKMEEEEVETEKKKREKGNKKAKDHEPLSCNLYGLSGSKGLMHKGRPRQVDAVKLEGCVSEKKADE